METLTPQKIALLKEPTREEYVGTPTHIFILNLRYTLLAGEYYSVKINYTIDTD